MFCCTFPDETKHLKLKKGQISNQLYLCKATAKHLAKQLFTSFLSSCILQVQHFLNELFQSLLGLVFVANVSILMAEPYIVAGVVQMFLSNCVSTSCFLLVRSHFEEKYL